VLTELLRRRRSRRLGRRDDRGFTAVELAVTCLVMGIAFGIAGESFVSLATSSTHNSATVVDEQSTATAMAQVQRDIRSASTLSIPAGAVSSDELQLTILASDGTTSNVRWIYTPATETLDRQLQTSTGWNSTGFTTTSVSNGTATPVFTYHDLNGNDISSSLPSNIATCTTLIGVEIDVSPTIHGVQPFQEQADVALTNQVATLTAPGNGQCGGAA
jgi:type II secretory pathway pseudopilin PulG